MCGKSPRERCYGASGCACDAGSDLDEHTSVVARAIGGLQQLRDTGYPPDAGTPQPWPARGHTPHAPAPRRSIPQALRPFCTFHGRLGFYTQEGEVIGMGQQWVVHPNGEQERIW